MTRSRSNLRIEDHGNDFTYQKKKTGLNIQFNRVAFIFFIFFGISIIFSVKSIYLGSLKKNVINNFSNNLNYRSSILDRNGNILAKTVFTTNVGLNPNLVIDKKRLLLNLRLIFQDKTLILLEIF